MKTADMYAPMREYFKTCTDNARNQFVKRKDKEIASLAGLSIKLDITKAELMAMQGGTPEQQKFYGAMMAEYEVCLGAMHAACLIDGPTYKKQIELCDAQSTESDRVVNVIFPNWNAPDNYEDYLEIEAIANEHGLSIRQLKKVLVKALGSEKK